MTSRNIISLLALTALGVFLSRCSNNSKEFELKRIFCDAENITNDSNGIIYFETDNILFGNGITQSDERAFSGKYSCKLTSERQHGMSYTFKDVKAGDIFKASVWRYSVSGNGVIVAQGNWDFFKDAKVVSKIENGWELLNLKVVITGDAQNRELKFFPWLPEVDDSVYFDDFFVKKITDEDWIEPIIPAGINTINLTIDSLEINKLRRKRHEAFIKGVLVTKQEDWIRATLGWKNDVLPIKLRLKGDWTDHLEGRKWSFRIKIQDNNNWQKMKVFSIQKPEVRHFLNEWVFHKLLYKEDILTPRYGFVFVKLNSKILGLYAYEEHFKNTLLQYYKRREGVIVKFSEDEIWNIRAGNNLKGLPSLYLFESSNIQPFSKNDIKKSKALRDQFEIAQNLMHQYKYGLRSTSEIFDIELLARYYALIDLCKANHGTRWHNQRFYYNPITGKLEPVAFDNYPEAVFNLNENQMMYLGKERVVQQLFGDKDFIERYIDYLRKYTAGDFLSGFFEGIMPELEKFEEYLKIEHPDYQYNTTFLKENAATIRNFLDEVIIDSILNTDYKYSAKTDNINIPDDSLSVLFPVKGVSVKAYQSTQSSNRMSLTIESFHNEPIEIIGTGKNFAGNLLRSSIILPAYVCCSPPEVAEINDIPISNNIFFKIQGSDSIFSEKISKQKQPINYSPAQEIFSKTLMPATAYKISGNTILFKSGYHNIRKDIIIPESFKVVFEPGVILSINNKAKFISKSPVLMRGTKQKPIIIKSEDGTANGFTILQAKGKSYLNYVIFDNFNTLDYNGWSLTGAVNFYESDVEINHSSFINNNCEDALNIIRSNFIIDNTDFSNTSSDGFDADFCNGKISNTSFHNIGNDGIDLSGSTVVIANCTINGSADKAISIGEASEVTIEFISINNAAVGIVSKDLSEVNIQNMALSDCKYGLIAFQKKAGYGPAKITIDNYTAENVENLYLVEKGSVLFIDNKEMQ